MKEASSLRVSLSIEHSLQDGRNAVSDITILPSTPRFKQQ